MVPATSVDEEGPDRAAPFRMPTIKFCNRIGRMPGTHITFFLGFLFILLAPLQAKQPKEPVVTPSFAKPVKAVVFTGGEVEIPLKANAPVGGTKYLLRSQPHMGALGELIATEDGRATIIYRHDPRSGTGMDEFTYAVQSPGAAVSSRATVSIQIINRPPHIEAPLEIDFGSMPVGSAVRQIVTLRNSGGEPFSGRMQFSSPWESELGRLEIPAGGSADVPVEFKPDAARAFSGTWYIDGGADGTSIKLMGVGYVVLDVSPSFLKLQDSKDGSRSAKLTVANKTADPITIDFECPPEIHPISPLVIKGNRQVEVAVEASADRAIGGRTAVVVKEKRVFATVEILIPPLPASLSIRPSPTLDFGEISPGKSAVRELTLKNAGGIPAAIEISCPNWILSDATHVLVKPDEQRDLRLEAAATRPGMLRDRMLFKWENASAEIIVAAMVPGGQAAVAKPTATPAQNTSAPTVDLGVTKKQALSITKISQEKGLVTICWQDPNPDPHTYRIDSLRISTEASLARQAAIAPDVGSNGFSPEQLAAERLKFTKLFEQSSKNDRVVKTWSPLEKLEIQAKGNATFETTFPAPPGQQVIRIRISSILSDGSTSPIQTEIRIPIEQPTIRHWPVKTILFWLVGLASLAVLIRKFWKR